MGRKSLIIGCVFQKKNLSGPVLGEGLRPSPKPCPLQICVWKTIPSNETSCKRDRTVTGSGAWFSQGKREERIDKPYAQCTGLAR